MGCARTHAWELSQVLVRIVQLADGFRSFRIHCVTGILANEDRIHSLLHESLMLVTALNTKIGYDSASVLPPFSFCRSHQMHC